MMAKKILVLDDDKAILDALGLILTSKGFEVFKASTASEAVNIFRKNEINLSLLDVMLGGKKTGFDVFNEILEINNKARAIFVTAVDSDSRTRLDLKTKGACDYIIKPFDNDELLRAVNRALKEIRVEGKIIVGYGEVSVEKAPVKIQTVLGSCVAVVLYDPVLKIGGMTHIMLPKGKTRFDTAGARESIEHVLSRMHKLGADKSRLVCEIYGGSNVIKTEINVGEKNILKAKEFLSQEGIIISKEDTGGKRSRQICLDTSTGKTDVIYLDPIRS